MKLKIIWQLDFKSHQAFLDSLLQLTYFRIITERQNSDSISNSHNQTVVAHPNRHFLHLEIHRWLSALPELEVNFTLVS